MLLKFVKYDVENINSIQNREKKKSLLKLKFIITLNWTSQCRFIPLQHSWMDNANIIHSNPNLQQSNTLIIQLSIIIKFKPRLEIGVCCCGDKRSQQQKYFFLNYINNKL